jgi:hypothetical protein
MVASGPEATTVAPQLGHALRAVPEMVRTHHLSRYCALRLQGDAARRATTTAPQRDGPRLLVAPPSSDISHHCPLDTGPTGHKVPRWSLTGTRRTQDRKCRWFTHPGPCSPRARPARPIDRTRATRLPRPARQLDSIKDQRYRNQNRSVPRFRRQDGKCSGTHARRSGRTAFYADFQEIQGLIRRQGG